jgi:phage-related protein
VTPVAVGFKIADGYVEVHARADRRSARNAARQVADDFDNEGRSRSGSFLKWLFTPNPQIMETLSRPIAKIFSTPILLGIAAAGVAALASFLATAITTAILGGIALGFIGLAAFILKDNKKIAAAYERLGKRVQKSLERAAQPMIEPLVRGMNLIGDWVERMEPALKRIFTGVAPMVEPLINGFMGLLNNMLPGIERALPGIQAVVDALAVHLPGLGTAIGDFFATLAENEELLTRAVGLMITWLDILFKVAGPILIYFVNQFVAMAEAWNLVSAAVKAGTAWFVANVVPAWLKFQETMLKVVMFIPGLLMALGVKIKDFAMAVPGWLGSAGSAIGDFFVGLWDTVTGAVTTAFNAVVGFFAALPGRIWGAIQALPGLVVSVFWQVFDGVFYAIGYAIGTWIRMWMDLPKNIMAIWNSMWNAVHVATTAGLAFISNLWNAAINAWHTAMAVFLATIQNIWNAAWNGVKNAFSAAVNFITTTLPQKIGQWISAVRNFPPTLGGIITDAWNRGKRAFSDGANAIWNRAKQIPGQVKGALGNAGQLLYNVGRDILRGMINGINSMIDAAMEAAKRAARRVLEGAKDALGIGSPSKLFADQVGRWIPEGIRVGIERNAGAPDQAIRDLAMPTFTTMPQAPASTPAAATGGNTYITNNITLNANNLNELQQVLDFMNGKLQGSTKGLQWAGNIYESQGAFTRSHA